MKLTEEQKKALIDFVESLLNVGADESDKCVYCGHVHPIGECFCGCNDYD